MKTVKGVRFSQKMGLLVLGGLLGLTSTSALAASPTPFGPDRFPTNEATYAITTASPYYRNIWQKAINAWNKTGAFHFKASSATEAQIKLSRFSATQLTQFPNYTGVALTWQRDHFLTRAEADLNQSLLKALGYSGAERLHVAEHELGHTMGLGHNPSSKSVMYYRNRAYGIQKVDITAVKLRYATPAGQTS